MTLVEMLIALAILGLIITFASSGIVQSLMVNRLQEDATNTQSKLRRVTEIVTQELRSAVLGTISDFPSPAGHHGVSFVLMSGDGGIPVEPSPGGSWGTSSVTYVYSSSPDPLDALVGGPALLVNGRGEAVFIPEVTSVGGSFTGSGSSPKIVHAGCSIPVDYTPNTRIYGVYALGFEYKAAEQTLYQHTYGTNGLIVEPMAYNLSEFALAYEYTSAGGSILETEPRRTEGGRPQPVVEDGGSEYELSRLHLSMQSSSGDVERGYTGFIELSGLGNEERPITSIVACGEGASGPGGSTPGDDEGGEDEEDGGEEDEGEEDEGGEDEEEDEGDDEDDHGGGGRDPLCFWVPFFGKVCF